MTISQSSRLVTTAEAAHYIGCSVSFLATDRITGKHGVPFCRVGRVVRYDLSEVDAWLKSNRKTVANA